MGTVLWIATPDRSSPVRIHFFECIFKAHSSGIRPTLVGTKRTTVMGTRHTVVPQYVHMQLNWEHFRDTQSDGGTCRVSQRN